MAEFTHDEDTVVDLVRFAVSRDGSNVCTIKQKNGNPSVDGWNLGRAQVRVLDDGANGFQLQIRRDDLEANGGATVASVECAVRTLTSQAWSGDESISFANLDEPTYVRNGTVDISAAQAWAVFDAPIDVSASTVSFYELTFHVAYPDFTATGGGEIGGGAVDANSSVGVAHIAVARGDAEVTTVLQRNGVASTTGWDLGLVEVRATDDGPRGWKLSIRKSNITATTSTTVRLEVGIRQLTSKPWADESVSFVEGLDGLLGISAGNAIDISAAGVVSVDPTDTTVFTQAGVASRVVRLDSGGYMVGAGIKSTAADITIQTFSSGAITLKTAASDYIYLQADGFFINTPDNTEHLLLELFDGYPRFIAGRAIGNVLAKDFSFVGSKAASAAATAANERGGNLSFEVGEGLVAGTDRGGTFRVSLGVDTTDTGTGRMSVYLKSGADPWNTMLEEAYYHNSGGGYLVTYGTSTFFTGNSSLKFAAATYVGFESGNNSAIFFSSGSERIDFYTGAAAALRTVFAFPDAVTPGSAASTSIGAIAISANSAGKWRGTVIVRNGSTNVKVFDVVFAYNQSTGGSSPTVLAFSAGATHFALQGTIGTVAADVTAAASADTITISVANASGFKCSLTGTLEMNL